MHSLNYNNWGQGMVPTNMMGSDLTKRTPCARCHRPRCTCICGLIRPIANHVELLILQDTQEATHSKNTAGLLHLSLINSHVMPSNANTPLDSGPLREALYAGGKCPLLLYPPTPEAKSLGLQEPAAFPQAAQPEQLRLVVLDATWRKSRKLLYLNPLLQRLPRIALENSPPSLYLIRKADSENQLSTLEASCYALQQLEQGRVDYSPLLDAMRKFVARQSAFRPAPPIV